MRSRYRISVGGVQMDSLDDNLLILNIGYSVPERDVKKNSNGTLNGYEIGESYVSQRLITVTFELHIYDVAERNEVCQKVNNWAAVGGTLITNDRAGQRLLNAVCEQYADIDSARDWTAPLTIVFASTYNPYFVSNDEVTRTLTGKNVSGTMTLDGNVGSALVKVSATAQAAVHSLKLTVGDTVLELTGLSVATGQSVVIDYVHNRYLRIKANGSSVMSKLLPTSSDNLKAECGKVNSIGVVADGKVSAVFTARGCWR